MGARITVEEITGYTDQKVEEMEKKVVDELKPEVREIYNRRIEEINQKKPAGPSEPAAGAS